MMFTICESCKRTLRLGQDSRSINFVIKLGEKIKFMLELKSYTCILYIACKESKLTFEIIKPNYGVFLAFGRFNGI